MIRSNTTVSQGIDQMHAREKGMYGALTDLPVISQKGHCRRAELLESLDIGDVSGKVIADFGTGSWGIAGIYPRLHRCKFAYGLDISKTAIEAAAKLSREGNFPYGQEFEYRQSDGLDLPLPDESLDILFGGESIEHVRFPRRFLAEAYRVLKSSGQLILTTPNRDALLYNAHDDIYCSSPEHFWLFNTSELVQCVSELFDIKECYGFNGSIYRELDKAAKNEQACEAWANMFHHQPELGTGVVLRALKKRTGGKKRYEMRNIDSGQVVVTGGSMLLDLEFGLRGTMIDSADAKIEFTAPPADGLVLQFWSHNWSGFARVQCGTQLVEQNLWAKDPGWKQFHFHLTRVRSEAVRICASGCKDERAISPQVIFFDGFTYTE
jgi:ubiquinone/menaquinone biosynthesis C-methylase UbiE